jgi:hypothetical protein
MPTPATRWRAPAVLVALALAALATASGGEPEIILSLQPAPFAAARASVPPAAAADRNEHVCGHSAVAAQQAALMAKLEELKRREPQRAPVGDPLPAAASPFPRRPPQLLCDF